MGVSSDRVQAILAHQKKWLNGTVITYAFINGPVDQKKAMRKAFSLWMDIGMGLEFKEIAHVPEAMMRVAFAKDGSWSYVGRDILNIAKGEPTLNIGWDITGSEFDTGVHEIGHTIGLEHEHQNRNSGIVWDEAAVYAALAQPPNNWDRDTTYRNIIAKLDPREVRGTKWDPDSVMEYPFEAGLILKPEKYRTEALTPAGGLSPLDIDWVRSTYPTMGKAAPKQLLMNALTTVPASTGGNAEFNIRPDRSEMIDIQTFGNTDCVMALYEKRKDQLIYLGGTDDSATEQNAHLKHRLHHGSEYVLKLRMMYVEKGSANNIMMW